MRIFISDAISHNRENLASYLSESGLEVVGTAASGTETLKLAKVHKPNLIILDINLPDADVLKLISILNEFENKPVVLLLMVSHDHVVEQLAVQAGAYTCLAKNEGIAPLVDTIQKIQNTNFQRERVEKG